MRPGALSKQRKGAFRLLNTLFGIIFPVETHWSLFAVTLRTKSTQKGIYPIELPLAQKQKYHHMQNILDEDIIDHSLKQEDHSFLWRAVFYLSSMAMGAMAYGLFAPYGWGNRLVTILSISLLAVGLMFLLENAKQFWARWQSIPLVSKYPLWFERLESTMAFWVWIVALTLIMQQL